jgi:hypothetical protein
MKALETDKSLEITWPLCVLRNYQASSPDNDCRHGFPDLQGQPIHGNEGFRLREIKVEIGEAELNFRCRIMANQSCWGVPRTVRYPTVQLEAGIAGV